jgi:hypothetical protein
MQSWSVDREIEKPNGKKERIEALRLNCESHAERLHHRITAAEQVLGRESPLVSGLKDVESLLRALVTALK